MDQPSNQQPWRNSGWSPLRERRRASRPGTSWWWPPRAPTTCPPTTSSTFLISRWDKASPAAQNLRVVSNSGVFLHAQIRWGRWMFWWASQTNWPNWTPLWKGKRFQPDISVIWFLIKKTKTKQNKSPYVSLCPLSWLVCQRCEEGCSVHGRRSGGQPGQSPGEPARQRR